VVIAVGYLPMSHRAGDRVTHDEHAHVHAVTVQERAGKRQPVDERSVR
jgi:hypothetical protein